ncbi:MAG: glucose-1-phosphate thymidylyltransferase [Firmicutes bacterium]|nr:glucose-1-phosphate thymidylyltransferase [Bacillota bacterium]
MKGLILSGGAGTRLRPLTYTNAKQLIPVGNKPVLFYAIEALRDAGVTDLGLVVGDTRAEIMAAVGDGSRWGVRVTYVHQEAPLGLAHAVKVARDFIGDDDFVVFLGDNLIRDGIAGFVRRFAVSRPDALILLSRVDEPQRFGVAELRGDQVVRLVEKPEVPPSDLGLVGVYLFTPGIFEAIEAIEPSWRNELEITDAIQRLIDRGRRVEWHMVTGWWKDTGKPEDVLEANRLVLETIQTDIAGELDQQSQTTGKVVLAKGARVEGSFLRGPVCIGEGAVISGSYIGLFTSVGPRVTIRNAEVEYSVVMEGATISDISPRIDRSLIGRNVLITGRADRPRALRFVLGDSSQAHVG